MLEKVLPPVTRALPDKAPHLSSSRQETILLRGVVLQARIGASEEERASPQELLLNCDIDIGDREACFTDRLEDTIDYAEIVRKIRSEVSNTNFALLESLGQCLCRMILADFGARSIRLEIFKIAVIGGVQAAGIRTVHLADEIIGDRLVGAPPLRNSIVV
jgi:7,8-dihydroneopterin aldolase/epimerase/oxygenase